VAFIFDVLDGDDCLFALERCRIELAGVDIVAKSTAQIVSQYAVFGQRRFVVLASQIADIFSSGNI
jgi:hypothetical protein